MPRQIIADFVLDVKLILKIALAAGGAASAAYKEQHNNKSDMAPELKWKKTDDVSTQTNHLPILCVHREYQFLLIEEYNSPV